MKLFIARATEKLVEGQPLCVKHSDKEVLLPAWLSETKAREDLEKMGENSCTLSELTESDYARISDWHKDAGLILFLHIRRDRTSSFNKSPNTKAE